MKTIALIDTRSEVPVVSLGMLVSAHETMAAASPATTLPEDRGCRWVISGPKSTLKDRLDVGQVVEPAHLGGKQINQEENPN
jgi:hypothetical protein